MPTLKALYFLAVLTLSIASFRESILTLASIPSIQQGNDQFPSIIYVDTTDLETELIDE